MKIKNALLKLRSALNDNLSIVLAYFILALFFTFPLILNITDSIATGKNAVDNEYTVNSDSLYFIWNVWSFKYNLIDIGTSPFSHSDLIFYPNGFNASAGGYDNIFNSLLALPLQLVSGNLLLIYNILIFFNFVFAAYSAYLLANYLTGDKKISFLSGIIFGFSPYMIARSITHLNMLTAGAIPLFILFYLKLLKEPNFKNSLFLAIAFFLVTISTWQYGLFTIIFIFFSSIFFAFYRKKRIFNKTYLKNFLYFVILSILLLLPVAFPMIKATLEKKSIPSNFGETIAYSADPFSYLTPIPLSNLGAFADPVIFNYFSNNMIESTAYLGFLEITILVLAFHKRKTMEQKTKYWLYLFVVFLILSFGPYLKIFKMVFNEIPLPYYFLAKYIPFFNFAKEPVRLSIFIALFSSMIFAFTLKYIFSAKNYQTHKNALLVFFALAIIAERTIFPYPIEKIETPLFYQEISREKENYAILDLPVDSILGFSFYNYYQTMHGKNITSGKIMPYAFSDDSYSFIKKDGFLSQNTCIFDKNIADNPYNPPDSSEEIKKLQKNNIKYVIIHKNLIDYFDSIKKFGGREYDCRPLRRNVEMLFGKDTPVYEDRLIKVYSIL